MKTILFITAFPPNNKSGGQYFSLNTIRELSKLYRIDLIYFDYKEHEIECENYIRRKTKLLPSFLNILYHPLFFPLFTKRYNRKMITMIQNITDKYDYIFFDYSQVGLLATAIIHPHKIIRCHDVIYQKYSRRNNLLGYWAKQTEKYVLNCVEMILVTSQKDVDIIRKIYGLKSYYTNEYIKPFEQPESVEFSDSFIFYGLWSRKENLEGLLWFFNHVIPILKNKHNFIVLGGGIKKSIYKRFFLPNDIQYFGFVSDPLIYLYRCNALLAPIFHGAGVKIKVVDAFSTGTPVIGTDIAFEGLPQILGLMHTAHTAEEYAAIIDSFCPLTVGYKKKLSDQFKNQCGPINTKYFLELLDKNDN